LRDYHARRGKRGGGSLVKGLREVMRTIEWGPEKGNAQLRGGVSGSARSAGKKGGGKQGGGVLERESYSIKKQRV